MEMCEVQKQHCAVYCLGFEGTVASMGCRMQL